MIGSRPFSQAAAIEGDETNGGDHQVETWDEGATAWTVPKADAWGDNPVEPLNERPDAAVKRTVKTKRLGDGPTTKTQTEGGAGTEGQIGVHAEEVNVLVKEEEFEVPNEETVEVIDTAWGLRNTTPKVADEGPEATLVQITALMPDQEGTLDFEGMPGLEDVSSEEIMGEEPPVDIPLTEGPPALPWVHFKAQICQDEIQYWVAMFTWFRYMHPSWEESQRKKDDA